MGSKEKIECHVKKYRLAKRWSQEELAKRIGVKRQAVYDIESGRYLPNTAVAIRLARVFGCRVEDLFVENTPMEAQPVRLVDGAPLVSSRVILGRVRDQLVAVPLQGAESVPFGLRSADGLLAPDGKRAHVLMPVEALNKTIFLMGCDPALDILGQHTVRSAPYARVHCRFASSLRALDALAEGIAHVAGTHLHNTDHGESNVITAGQKLGSQQGIVLGFSLLEEGLMVAKDNPLGLRTVADLAQPMVRFVNREKGAALRVLLDDHLERAGILPDAVNGYSNEVFSHRDGAFKLACNVADAALGFRAVAEAFDLGFVPIATARCDLVIPADLHQHPTIKVLLDVLQSAALKREIDAIAGYDASVTGKTIAALKGR